MPETTLKRRPDMDKPNSLAWEMPNGGILWSNNPPMETCPKCGVQAAAFICSTPGCPVNGGAAYG